MEKFVGGNEKLQIVLRAHTGHGLGRVPVRSKINLRGIQMFQAAAGFGPNVEDKVIVLERRGLRSSGNGLKHGNRGGDGFLQIVYKLGEVFFVLNIVDNDMVSGAEDFKILFGEVGNFERSVGEPVVISGAEGVVGSVFHPSCDYNWFAD